MSPGSSKPPRSDPKVLLVWKPAGHMECTEMQGDWSAPPLHSVLPCKKSNCMKCDCKTQVWIWALTPSQRWGEAALTVTCLLGVLFKCHFQCPSSVYFCTKSLKIQLFFLVLLGYRKTEVSKCFSESWKDEWIALQTRPSSWMAWEFNCAPQAKPLPCQQSNLC